jgi:uncharacterized protein YbjT (DUF2867 family)
MIGVVGGGGRVGRLVVARLVARGLKVVAIVRDRSRTPGMPPEVQVRTIDEADALAGLRAVACCAPVVAIPGLAAALGDAAVRLVAVGSTRRFTGFPDPAADLVRAAEAAVLARAAASLILHPTMIYGAAGENNVKRIAALIRRARLLPLPGGGKSLIQPIHVEDVADCVVAALLADPPLSGTLMIAGPAPLTWAEFARAIAAAAGLRVAILPVPLGLARLAGAAARLVPGVPRVTQAELERLLEDKDFDIAPMRQRLGVVPRPLEEGLRATLPGDDSAIGSD